MKNKQTNQQKEEKNRLIVHLPSILFCNSQNTSNLEVRWQQFWFVILSSTMTPKLRQEYLQKHASKMRELYYI